MKHGEHECSLRSNKKSGTEKLFIVRIVRRRLVKKGGRICPFINIRYRLDSIATHGHVKSKIFFFNPVFLFLKYLSFEPPLLSYQAALTMYSDFSCPVLTSDSLPEY